MASLRLGVYTGDNRVVDKSSNIQWAYTNNFVELANGSNEEYKIIMLEIGSADYDDVHECNYAEIDGEYYYVRPFTIGVNNLIQIECDIDYLHTFKDEIYNLECIVERSASSSNAYLYDPQYVVSTKTETITKQFPYGIENDSIILMTVG